MTSYDFSRYGGLEGEVVRIGADSQVDSDSGTTYFEVVVKTRRNYLGDDPQELRITPGMEATVEVHTGSRTVLAYLIRPVLKLRDEGFRER